MSLSLYLQAFHKRSLLSVDWQITLVIGLVTLSANMYFLFGPHGNTATCMGFPLQHRN